MSRRSNNRFSDLAAAWSFFAAAAALSFLVPFFHLKLALLLAVPVFGWLGYHYLESYSRRSRGVALEKQAAAAMIKVMSPLGFGVKADVVIKYGNIDFIATVNNTRYVIEIKPWWSWGNGSRYAHAIRQVMGQIQEVPGRPVIYLPAARKNFCTKSDGVMIIGGRAEYLADRLLVDSGQR